jgi:hypothetical protein
MRIWQLINSGMYGRRFQAPVGEDGGEGGGGSGGSADDDDDGGELEKAKPTQRESELLKESMKRKQKITDLTATNTTLLGKVSEIEKSLKTFEGIDPAVFKTMVEESNQRKEKELEGAEDWNGLKDKLTTNFEAEKVQMLEQHTTKLGESKVDSQQTIDDLTAKLKKSDGLISGLTVNNAFGNSQFVTDKIVPSSSKVQKLYGDYFDVVNGKMNGYDKPHGSEERQLLVDEAGKALTFEKALIKIVESDPDKDSILRAPIKPGADSSTDGREETKTTKGGVGRIRGALNKS